MSSSGDIAPLLELLTDRIVNHGLPVEEARAILLRRCYAKRLARPKKTLAEIERETIQECLDRHDGNVSEAARELGISRVTVYRKTNSQP